MDNIQAEEPGRMHCSRVEDGVEAFVELGTLIVEGRLPAEGTDKGYNEGPHCPKPATHAHLDEHQCDHNDFLCIRAERLRKHMLLLCNNAVPMCVEVLLCPVCQCGTERAKNPEIANIPSPSDHLLEQWTVSVVHVSGEPCNMSVRGLFQAVRSQLHFSQLSAWWSSSRGTHPTNVCYRVTLPGEAFSSQFSRPPVHHVFPPAAVGPNTQLKVSVRILPRSEALPSVKCATCTPEASVRKRSVGLEQPMLGESLLDPPGPSSSRAHAGLCKWHTSSPPSPPRRRPSRPPIARRCDKHPLAPIHIVPLPGPVDDRMQTNCNQHGKHDCRCEEDVEEIPPPKQKHSEAATNKINLDLSKKEIEEVLTVLRVRAGEEEHIGNITTHGDKVTGKGDLLLSAILRSSQSNAHTNSPPTFMRKQDPNNIKNPDPITTCGITTNYSKKYLQNLEIAHCDKGKENKAILSSTLLDRRILDRRCSPVPEQKVPGKRSDCKVDPVRLRKATDYDQSGVNISPLEVKSTSSDASTNNRFCSPVDMFRTKECMQSNNVNKCQEEPSVLVEGLKGLDLNKRMEPCSGREVPTALDKAKFRRSLDSAASMVFHWRTGLPLTSSPAPLRRASQCFDYDSSLNSVSAIRSALFDSESGDDTESEGSSKSPCSPQIDIHMKKELWATQYQSPSSALLGSFEESVLNGRLEPVSTVQGFTADLGASGSFCPAHLVLPVTVFFYTLGDNDKVSSPYLAHINLGKKGYVVPRCGTIQVTLLNPLGTVIKMFVVMYNLSDIPNNSHTFLRQRTLYMPANTSEPLDNSQKYLRYLIHLRFASSKSGRLTLHTDIRMVIFRKSDMDTATGHGVDKAYELRSFTNGPTNPKFSPRK